MALLQSCAKEIEKVLNSMSNFSFAPNEQPPNVPTEPENLEFYEGVDPIENQAWHLENTGQRSYALVGGMRGEDINGKVSHLAGHRGEGIKIAISDNGVEIFHPDLVHNSWFGQHRNYSYQNSDYWNSDPTPDGDVDTDAHGTAVTGIIAATFNNSLGSRGIASKAEFGGFLYIGTPYDLTKTLDQTNGPFDIFNFSYGRNTCFFQDLPDALILQLDYGVSNLRSQKGAIYIKAAGNEYFAPLSSCIEGESGYYFGNSNLEEDNSYPFIIVVGANTAYGNTASYSTPGSSLWISAPGGDYGINYPAIITTDLTGCSKGFANSESGYNNFDEGKIDNDNCDYTSTMNGTSAAAPMVSGAVGVILGVRNDLTWRDVKYILALSARKVDENRSEMASHPLSAKTLDRAVYEHAWQQNGAGFHFHNWYGFGALDIDKAVAVAQNFPSLGNSIFSTTWRNESPALNEMIPDNNPEGVISTISVEDNLSIEAVQIRVTIEHPHASELGIILESPSGMKSTLLYYNSGMIQTDLIDEILLSNAFLGESAQGDWKLKVFDGLQDNSGKLVNWKINFWGHYPDGNEEKRLTSYYSTQSSTLSTSENVTLPVVSSANNQVVITNIDNQKESTLTIDRSDFKTKIIKLYALTLANLYKQRPELKNPDVVLDQVFYNGNFSFVFKNKDDYIFFKYDEPVFTQRKIELQDYTFYNNDFVRIDNEGKLFYANQDFSIDGNLQFLSSAGPELAIVTLEDVSKLSLLSNSQLKRIDFNEIIKDKIFSLSQINEEFQVLTLENNILTKLVLSQSETIKNVASVKFEHEILKINWHNNSYHVIYRDALEERIYYMLLSSLLEFNMKQELIGQESSREYLFIEDQLFGINKDEIIPIDIGSVK